MKIMRILTVFIAIGCLCLAMSSTLWMAENTAAPGPAVLEKLLKAVEDNDYNSFVADGNDAFKAGITKQLLQGVSGLFAPRLKKGYECSYLGQLKQQGHTVLLWKITFKDGGDDTLAKLGMKDEKVAGFWLQ
jgi:hypothetical protein